MLTADALAALADASPDPPPAVSSGSAASESGTGNPEDPEDGDPGDEDQEYFEEDEDDEGSAVPQVGKVRTAHAAGTTDAVNSVEKWVLAALRHLGATPEALLFPDHAPNDALASRVHKTIAQWRLDKTTARDAGVLDSRPHILAKPPQQCALAKTRAWLLRHVNRVRADHDKRRVSNDWARNLAGVREDVRETNSETRDAKAKSGVLYHHKHDLAPTYEELTTMCRVGFTGDRRVDVDPLRACEAGMAIALYLPTGARGSELKKMHLQSVGHETIRHERAGITFECLKMVAFETKTKDQHLNQMLPASHPWRCGVGAFGVSLLVRVRRYGPPPFEMQKTDASWKIIGSDVNKSFDRRLRDVFAVAGVRRQQSDPLTYLGRHLGTRLLQHAGGTSEGGAARRGHGNGTASFHYTEVPLPDLSLIHI